MFPDNSTRAVVVLLFPLVIEAAPHGIAGILRVVCMNSTTSCAYERFHYLNRLAEAVCAIGHTTNVAVRGLRLANGG